jgi:hypothetical protein
MLEILYFSSVGLSLFSGKEKIQELIKRVVYEGRSFLVPTKKGGSYHQFKIGNGIELWVSINAKNEIEGIMPYFNGQNVNKLRVEGGLESDSFYYEGAFLGFTVNDDNAPHDDGVKVIFENPGYRLTLAKHKFPAVLNVSLTAFAHKIELYDNVEAYVNVQKAENSWGANCNNPMNGKAFHIKKGDFEAYPEAFLSGVIRSSRRILNPLTEEFFYWCQVETDVLLIDVVFDKTVLNKEPECGNVLRCECWIAGKIL